MSDKTQKGQTGN